MVELIRATGDEGVHFVSGDVHWGEISREDVPGLYPLWDVTSSGLTETWPSVEPNRNRVGDVVRENNFGEIEIDWTGTEPRVALRLFDVGGTLRNEVRLEKRQLSRGAAESRRGDVG
jgi:alkaline phosphatase D